MLASRFWRPLAPAARRQLNGTVPLVRTCVRSITSSTSSAAISSAVGVESKTTCTVTSSPMTAAVRAQRRVRFGAVTVAGSAQSLTLTSVTAPRRFTVSRRWLSSEAKTETDAETKQDTEAAADTDASSTENETNEMQAKLEARIEELEKEVADMKDRAMRAIAETENVRRRAEDDISKAHKFGMSSFAKNLLEVADNIDLALDNIPAEALEKDQHLKTLYEGVQMTQRVMLKVFEQNGIEKMSSMGEKFDPNFHDGLFQFEDTAKEPGSIGQVLKEGYILNGRVIRPANVGTVKAPSS
jgi:molecular chaperone GrpE